MKIAQISVIKGPNPWSANHHSLILLKLDTEGQDQVPLDVIQSAIKKSPYFFQKFQHDNNIHVPGFVRYIVTQLYYESGINCDYSDVRKAGEKDQYYILFSYDIEQVGIQTAEAAVRIAISLIKGQSYEIESEFYELEDIHTDFSIGATTTYILEEVKKRNIPYRQFNNGSLTTLGYGNKQKKIRTAITDSTSGLGIELAGDKEDTKKILDEAHIPVPKGILIRTEAGLHEFIHKVRFPLVVKPLDGNQGRGVTTNVTTMEGVLFGFKIAKEVSDYVIIEEFVTGDDYRFLVINYKLVAVTKRVPAFVKGDGESTIKQLIEEENRNPQRGTGPESVLALIKIDEVTNRVLENKNLTLDTVLPSGEALVLKHTANISAGGIAIDVTDKIHPENRFLAEHIARLFNLDICGIDIMAAAIDIPVTRETGAVIEVNAGPGIRMHSNPQAGKPRNVAMPIIDMLFPDKITRIPVIAITENRNKKSITHLIAHMLKLAGYKPGSSGPDGIYIDGHHTEKENSTNFESAQDVLFDPMIDFAILECNPDNIITSGLAFDHCNISVIRNIPQLKNNYFPEDAISTLKLVAGSTYPKGYAILNADDDKVAALREQLNCQIAFFSINENNPFIQQHCEQGGLAVVMENNHFTVCREKKRNNILKKTDISDTIGANEYPSILPVLLIATIYNIETEHIISAINKFIAQDLEFAK